MSNIWPTDSGYLAIMFKSDTTPTGSSYSGIETLELDSIFEVKQRHSIGDTSKMYTDWYTIHNTVPDGIGNFWYWNSVYFPADNSFWTYYGKFGQSGDTIFEKKLPNTGIYDSPWEMVAIPGGGGMLTQYATLTNNHERTRIYFFDAVGNITSQDSIVAYNNQFYHAALNNTVDLQRGEIYIVTNDYRYSSYAYDIRPRLFVYDFQGHRLRSMNYANTLRDHFLGYVYRTDDGGYAGMLQECVVDSSSWVNRYYSGIVKMDSSMNYQWKRTYWDLRFYNAPQTFDKDIDGNFFLGGIRDTSTNIATARNTGYLMKFSPSLDSMWLRLFAEPDSVASTIRVADQSLVLPDRSILFLMGHVPGIGKYSLLYRLDSCGHLVERCEVDTAIPPTPTPPDTIWPQPDGHVVAFPNPSNGLWNVVWDVNVGDESLIQIYDVAGREVLRSRIVREERPSILDLQDWAQGVYLLRIRSEEGRVFRVRLVLGW